jgi:O-antigen/teichoic acid export membrane protein
MAKIGIAQKIIRNTKFNALGRVWDIGIHLFLTPYIILRIGADRYGVFAIVSVLTGYFTLIDLGVGDSFLKYFSEYLAKNDNRRINEVANTGFVFYSLIGCFILAIVFPLTGKFLDFFSIESAMYLESLFAIRMGFIILVFSSVFGVFSYLLLGLQRMDVTNGISIALSVPHIIGAIIFLEMGFGLKGLMINNAISAFLIGFANFVFSKKLCEGLSFNPVRFYARSMLLRLIRFGYKLKVMHFAHLIIRSLDKLLIGHFLTIGLVTYYHLGSTIAYKAQTLPYIITSALLPAFGEIYFKKGKEKLIEGYLRGSKYMAILVAPFFIFIIASARNLLTLWMGPGYETSVFILRILSVGFLAYCLTWVTKPVLKTMEKHIYQMYADIIIVILNVVFSTILILKYGIKGVVFGTTIALAVGSVFLVIQFHRIVRIALFRFIKTISYIIASSIVSGILVFALDVLLQTFAFQSYFWAYM